MSLAGFLRTFGFAALAVVTLACSGDKTIASEPPPQTADQLSVQFTADTDSLLLGTTKLFRATVVNQFNAPRTAIVLWSSTNASVLTVTSQGMVTAIGEGSAQIVAAISGSTDSVDVNVYGLPAGLMVVPEAVSLPIGDEIRVLASTGDLAGGAGQPVMWTSSDTSIAIVNAEGLISAMGEGEVEITARLGGVSAKAGVEVFVPRVSSLTISPAVSSIATDASVELSVIARSVTGKKIGGRLPVYWSISDPTIATVNELGRVTGKKRGFTTVRATAGERSASATINVTHTAVYSVVATIADSSLLQGESVRAAAVVKDASGAIIEGLAVAWQSSNPGVATVDASGLVTAMTSGLTTISAISGGKVGSIPLSVGKGAATSLRILPAAPSVLVGATAKLTGNVVDQNGKPMAGHAISWSSSNHSVATVNAAGVLTGLTVGAVDITAASGQYSSKVRASVTPVQIASLSISPASSSIEVGFSLSLDAKARDSQGNLLTGRVMTWSSSNPSVVSLSAHGTATAIKPGNASVTVSAEGKSATALLTVPGASANAVASINLSANSSVLEVGQSTQAVATLRDASGKVLQGHSITWTTLDATIASVSSNGLITAVGGGSVAIIATSGGVSGSLAVTVEAPAAAAVATVSVALSPMEIKGGQTSKANVTLKDAQGHVLTGRTIAYSSSRVTVATVGGAGTVTGISAGEAGITAMSEGRSGKSFVVVSSGSPTIARVTVSASPTTLSVGGSTQASAVALDAGSNTIGSSFTWSSSNPSVVAVSSNGRLTAVAPGNATIKAVATSNGVAGTLGITVSTSAPLSVASVTLNLGSSSVPSNQTTQASAVARSVGGTTIVGQTFSYSSSNTTIATVSSSGVVSAKAAGSATISATAAGKVGSALLTVTSAAPPPPPPPPSTPPANAAAALAKIGPTISPAAAAALGGGYAKYDALWAKWEPVRWNAEGSDWSGNYYDRAQIYYAQWIRTGNATYKQRGDAMALDYRRRYLHASNYQTSPHWSQLDGIALHFWLTGDDSSRTALGKAAWNLAGSAQWSRTGQYTDARQQARSLIAMLLAWQTNAPNAPTGGWAKALDDGLNAILPQQSGDGAWRYPVNTCDLSLNYMGAMLMDALIRVHTQYRPDPRIPGVVKKSADFLWTQYRSKDAVPSFNYYEGSCKNQHGNSGPSATPDLTGLFVPMYAWMAAQDPAYRSKSDAVFAATMNGIYPQGSKQFNQAFAFGWRALGYLP